MDFHNMKRKELQRLCKQHDIPANLSNLEMVDKLSSFFKVEEEEKEKPVRKSRSCLKNSDELLSEIESDVLKKNVKKVRFSPENDVFQLGEKGFAVENKGAAGRVTRGRASLLCKTVLISPVVMKKKGKRAVQEVEKEDLVVENKDGASRVTRARVSLGKNVVLSSPVIMKKRAKRVVQEVEKKDLDVESKAGVSRVTRARALVGEQVLIPSPVVMKKRGKKVVQEDEKGDYVVENKGGESRVTRARAGKQVLIQSPVVVKRGKKAVQEDEKGDLVVENKGGASRVTRARAGKQVLISSPVVMKKRGKKAVQEEKKSGSAQFLVVDFTNPGVEEENEVTTVKFLRNRKVENVVPPKNIVRKKNTQKKSQSKTAKVSENKEAEADGGITQPEMGLRRSTRNVNVSEEPEGVIDETDQKVPRKNLRQSTRQRASAKSSIEDVDKKTVTVEFTQPEVITRQSKRNRQSTDESTRYQTRHGTRRMSVMPQTKKAKTEKPVAGNLREKNVVVKDSSNESTKPIVVEEGSETGHIRRSKRNASGDGSLVIAEDANGSGTDIKTVTTKKRRRDADLEEMPSQHTTGRRVNMNADNVLDMPEEETPMASEPRTRSGNRQASLMYTSKKLNMSGNLGPSKTAGEKASPRHTRGLSTVPKRSATGARQSKTVAVTPRTRSGSGQKSFIHATKKLRMSGNSGLHKTIGDKESPQQSTDISMLPRRSETESKGRGSKSNQTPVIHEHSRRFTRSALKGRTDGPAYVRGKIYQKKSQSVSKLPFSKVESSLPKATSERPLDIDVQSSYQEVDRSTVNLVSNASDLPENKTACSTPQGGFAKTSYVDLYVQESEGPEMINIHEVSPSDPLNLQSNHVELEVDISTLQGGSSKTSSVDLNVQESEGPELMNMREASPSDPLNLQSNNVGIEVAILTPQGGSPKTRSVDLNMQESEGPELINICEALPSDPLILQSNHAELEVDISTTQGSSPKASSVDLNVQESEGPELINIREASPGDPLNVQSNHAEFQVDISTPQGGSPKTSSVDLNVHESEGPELINIREASPGDPLNVQSNHAEFEVDILTPQGGSPKTKSVDLNVEESEGPELISIREASPGDPLNVQSNHAKFEVDISTPQGGSPKTSSVDINVQESEGPALINIREALPSDPLNLQSNDVGIEVAILTPQGGSPKTRSVDLNMQESEGPELINICEALPSDGLILQSNHAEFEVDISTPQGGSPKANSVDLNVQESEGPELISIREASPGDPLNVQSNHAKFEVDISTPQGGSPKTSSVDINVQKSEGPALINIREALPSGNLNLQSNHAVHGDVLNVQSNHAKFEVDISTPQGGSPKTSSVDINVQKSEGPALINIREALPSGTLNFQSNHAVHGDVNEDNTTKTQLENSCKTNVASPHLVHLKADAAAGDVLAADTNALTGISLVDQSTSTRTEERPELSNDVESISKGIDLNLVFQGPAIHEHEPVYQSALPEVAEIADNSVTGKSDAACITQQEGSTEVDAKGPPLDHLKSADNIDITGDAGSIDTDYVDDYHLNVEHINSSAIKEMQEVSENVNHVVAGGSTVNEEKSTAEVGDCGPTEQEHDNRKHPAEFPESGRLDKDSKSSSKEVGEAVSYADMFIQTGSMNFTVDKDDKMHPEKSVQADEPHNTISKSGMQEKEFPVPNSIANTEEVPVLEYEFSKPEFSDTITSTVMCSNKELEEDINQLSTVESCLMQEESGTNICIESSTSNIVADAVAGVNNKSQPTAPSSPLRATEFENIVEEVDEELKPEDSPLSSGSDIFERAAIDGSSLQNERNSAKSTDVSEHNHSKNAEVKSENRKIVAAFDSSTRGLSDMPEFTSSLPSHVTELGHLVAEVKEVKPRDWSSLWSTENVPKRTAEDGSSLHKQVGTEGRQVEETVFEDSVENASERTSSMFGDAHHILDSQLPTERGWGLEETMCSVSGDVEERRMNKNISRERTPVISEDDVDRDNISCPVIVHEFPSDVDHCHTPSEKSYGQEQGTDMSMVKSSKYFGKELSSQHDYHGSLDSCGKEQGTPMSMVKSSKNRGEEFSSQHDKIIEQVKFCCAVALPQTICEDFAGFDNEMVADLVGSTVEQMSRTGDLNSEKIEEAEPCTVITDNLVLEDGIESLKGNSSNLVRNLAEFEDSLHQFDVKNDDIDNNLKGICQENDERPYLVQMDVDTNNVESSRDNLIAGNTIHRFDREADASGVSTEELQRYEDAMDADAPANLQYGGVTRETNETQGVPTGELTRIENAVDADVPANLQYGHESLTVTGETNQALDTIGDVCAIAERGPEEISFSSDIFGSELNSRSDKVDREESYIWLENTSYMLDKSEDAGKGLEIFTVSPSEEQLHNLGEENAREKVPESIEIHHATSNNLSTGDYNDSLENSIRTLSDSHKESEANKNAHQKADCYNNNRSDEDFTRTES